jgi:hypothetical protein
MRRKCLDAVTWGKFCCKGGLISLDAWRGAARVNLETYACDLEAS